MSTSRGPYTVVGAALVLLGAILCGASLAVDVDEFGGTAVWDYLQPGTKVYAVGTLVLAGGFATVALAAPARWPRALAAVLAGMAAGWYAPAYGITDGQTGLIVAAVGAVVLLAGAVVLGTAATGAGETQTHIAWTGASAGGATYGAGGAQFQQATTAPGWDPDPQGGGLRYWDGSRWTEHVQSN